MLSFHNDQSVKEKYLSRVRRHREMDNIVQGIGWENGKGCAVGCTLQNYNYSRYPIELGLPEWLARLEDIIFENLPKKDSALWPEQFLQFTPVGVNVEFVKNKLSIIRLDRMISIQEKNRDNFSDMKDLFNLVIDAIKVVKRCHECKINKEYCDINSWSAAWSAAMSAASAAELAPSAAELTPSAAWSAASAEAAAESAAWSAQPAAWSAEWSAKSAARSAESAAWSEKAEAWSAEPEWSEAWSETWKKESELLLKLLSECK